MPKIGCFMKPSVCVSLSLLLWDGFESCIDTTTVTELRGIMERRRASINRHESSLRKLKKVMHKNEEDIEVELCYYHGFNAGMYVFPFHR